MRRLHKNIILTACALTLAYIIVSNQLLHGNQTGPSGLIHAQSSLFQPGAHLGAIPPSNSPTPFGAPQFTTIFEVISTDGDWARLRVDAKRTEERAQNSYLEMVKMNMRLNSNGAGLTDEEIEKEATKSLTESASLMRSMMSTNLPTDHDIWINLNAYPAIWFTVK